MTLDLIKARFYRRLEKVFITFESMAIGCFIGACVTILTSSAKLGAVVALVVFVIVTHYKRFVISKERGKQ